MSFIACRSVGSSCLACPTGSGRSTAAGSDAEGWEAVESVSDYAMIKEIERSIRQATNLFSSLGNRVAFSVGKHFGVAAGKAGASAMLGISAVAMVPVAGKLAEAAGGMMGDELKLALQKGAGKTYPRTQIFDVMKKVETAQARVRRPARRA